MRMKKFGVLFLMVVCSAFLYGAQSDGKSATDNLKDAGQNTTAAANKGAKKTARGAKKGTHKAAAQTEKGARKVKNNTTGTTH